MDFTVTQYPYYQEIPLSLGSHYTPQFVFAFFETLRYRALAKLQNMVEVGPGPQYINRNKVELFLRRFPVVLLLELRMLL